MYQVIVFVRLEQPLSETKRGTWLEEVSEMQENTTLVDAGQIFNSLLHKVPTSHIKVP